MHSNIQNVTQAASASFQNTTVPIYQAIGYRQITIPNGESNLKPVFRFSKIPKTLKSITKWENIYK